MLSGTWVPGTDKRIRNLGANKKGKIANVICNFHSARRNISAGAVSGLHMALLEMFCNARPDFLCVNIKSLSTVNSLKTGLGNGQREE